MLSGVLLELEIVRFHLSLYRQSEQHDVGSYKRQYWYKNP